jgi:Ribbon-helix-helix protein, copG family
MALQLEHSVAPEAIVKRTNIYLDEEQALLLRHLAVEEGRSFTDVVREALNAYLAHRGLSATSRVIGPRRTIPRDEWRLRFADAVARLRANVPPDLDWNAIEAEITAARDEVRRERAGRRTISAG